VRAAQGAASPPHDPLLGSLEPLLARLAGQTTRLTRLVDDVLDISRIQAGRLEIRRVRCELGALVREVVQIVQEGASDRVIALAPLPLEPVWVEADPARLAQVVENYLTNALKYAPAERPVRVGLERDEGHARVWVQDQGVGIEAAEQAHIWERFYRVEGVRHQAGSGIGLGLGLYISRTIVERQGGAVGVASSPGHGSTFWFTLPLVDGPGAGPQG
jgi:signal transduction histidine kinase